MTRRRRVFHALHVLQRTGATRQTVNPYPWFVEGVSGERQFGEDVAFCQRARALGYGVWVHTGVKTGHSKPRLLDEDLYDEYRQKQQMAEGTRAERRRAARGAA